MNESSAWLLNIGSGKFSAIGERELLHLVPQPEFLEVPLAPDYCRRVLPWQDQLLPVWDIPAWLRQDTVNNNPAIAAIVGYQSRRGQTPSLGVIALAEPPARMKVSDSQACELPEGEPGWKRITVSCFLYESKTVPILDLHGMFTSTPSDFF